MHTKLPQAHSDFWMVIMMNFPSNKKKQFSSNRNVEKKEFPNKKKEFSSQKKKEKKKKRK